MIAGAHRRYLFYVEENYCYGILRPIQQVLWRRGDEVAWLAVDQRFDRRGFRPDEQVLDNVHQAIAWNPVAVMVPGNFVPDFIPGIKVMVTHGLVSGKRRTVGRVVHHFIERGLFDLYIGHGPSSTPQWQRLAHRAGYFEVAECGWSKLDPLFDGSLVRTPADVPVIYFASTFSPRLAAAPQLVATVRALAQEHNWQWRIHFHPKMPAEIIDRYRTIESHNLRVVTGHDTLQLLLDADVMLCDTSSIISEFALLGKPVVTFRNVSPQPFMIDVRASGQVGPALQRALGRPPQIMQAIAAHARQTHPWQDGRSSERVVAATDRLVDKGLGHLRHKPMNLIRHWRMRRQLHYYRFF